MLVLFLMFQPLIVAGAYLTLVQPPGPLSPIWIALSAASAGVSTASAFGLWILMLRKWLRSEDRDRRWLFALLLAGPIGGLVYFLMDPPSERPGEANDGH